MTAEKEQFLAEQLVRRNWKIIHDTERYGETEGLGRYGPVAEFEGSLEDAESKAYDMSWRYDAGLDDQFLVEGAEKIREMEIRLDEIRLHNCSGTAPEPP